MTAPERDPDDAGATIEVRRRDDGSWDLVRQGGREEVLSNHPLRAMAESERFRLAQQAAEDRPDPDEDTDLGTTGAYPDNVGG